MLLIAMTFLFVIGGCVQNEGLQPDIDSTPGSTELVFPEVTDNTSSTLEPDNLPDIVEFDTMAVLEDLCREEYEGRLTGSYGNELAEEYIIGQFEVMKLLPLLKTGFEWEYEQPQRIRNIVGYLKGQDSTKAIIVSCHYDAVGKDGNEIVPGAVDNASGVAAVLRIAQTLSLQTERLSTDIIFCAFDGEENGYAGSTAFVKELIRLYENVININIDSIGLINGGSYMLGCDVNDVSSELNMMFKQLLDKHDIQYNSYPVKNVRSDHISFENAGIANINFTLNGILSVIHTKDDVVSNIDIEQINVLCDAIVEFILLYSSEL